MSASIREYQMSSALWFAYSLVWRWYELRRFRGDVPALACGETVVPAGDDRARREPLQVPFERRRQRFVEVVQVEVERAFRRAEQSKVPDVRVAACLHAQPGLGSGGEIGGHEPGRPAEEAERRCGHAPVAQPQELGEPVGLGGAERGDRVGTSVGRRPGRLLCTRNRGSHRAAGNAAFGRTREGRCIAVGHVGILRTEFGLRRRAGKDPGRRGAERNPDVSPSNAGSSDAAVIVLCVDGSDFSTNAVAAGFDLVRAAGRPLVVTVVDASDESLVTGGGHFGGVMSAEELSEHDTALEAEGRAVAEHAATALGIDGAEIRVVRGDPGPALCALATDVSARALVVGSRGRGGIKRAAARIGIRLPGAQCAVPGRHHRPDELNPTGRSPARAQRYWFRSNHRIAK